MARTILDDSPPLTPVNQLDFPYLAKPFPFWVLMAGAQLAPRNSTGEPPPHNAAPDPVE